MSASTFPAATIEGYPRVGPNRELKKALESYWAGRIDAETFTSTAHSLRVDTYAHLRELGLTDDYAIPADVAVYDQVLETALTVGLLGGGADEVSLDEYFALARGNAERAPLEMTKWFDTNYHYIVPEVAENGGFVARPDRVLSIVAEARAAGHTVRPYLVGPVTLLALSKPAEGAGNPLHRLAELTESYRVVLSSLAAAGVEWIQLAEPALTADLQVATDDELAAHAATAYGTLLDARVGAERPNVMVTTPYGSLRARLQYFFSGFWRNFRHENSRPD